MAIKINVNNTPNDNSNKIKINNQPAQEEAKEEVVEEVVTTPDLTLQKQQMVSEQVLQDVNQTPLDQNQMMTDQQVMQQEQLPQSSQLPIENEEDNKKKKKKKKNKKNESIDDKYKAYKRRKIGVYTGFCVGIASILFFGIYSLFIKHTPTPAEVTAYANKVNGVSLVQGWESGVMGFLQANLSDIINSNASANRGKIVVSNIAIEKNEQIQAGEQNLIVSYFSCDLTVDGTTQRQMFTLPIKIVDNKFIQAGELSLSIREAFSTSDKAYNSNSDQDELFKFEGEKDSKAVKTLEPVIDNFLELAYGGSSYSNIYKGSTPLYFTGGKYGGLSDVEYYPTGNRLGMNTKITYTVKLDNGITATNILYCHCSPIENDSWQIDSVL